MNDFTNFEKIVELEQAIRDLKFKCELRFKADIYSQLGIYGPNCQDYNVHDILYRSDQGRIVDNYRPPSSPRVGSD